MFTDTGVIISRGKYPSPFRLLNLIRRWMQMQLSWKGALKESSSCLFSSHQNYKKCIYGSIVKIWNFTVKFVSPEFFPQLHLLAPWNPNSPQELECPCADDAEDGCKSSSSCECEGLFSLLGQQRLPGLWWFSSQKKVIRINRCLLYLKVFFYFLFKH